MNRVVYNLGKAFTRLRAAAPGLLGVLLSGASASAHWQRPIPRVPDVALASTLAIPTVVRFKDVWCQMQHHYISWPSAARWSLTTIDPNPPHSIPKEYVPHLEA
jgi:hypothetical protein